MRRYFEKRGFGAVEYHAPDGSNDDVTGVYVNGGAWRIKRNLLGVWDDYFKFTFVRNPWDRVVSIYQYYKHGTEPENWEFRTDDKILEPTFKEFIFGVRNESHRLYSLVGLPQKDWLFDQDGNQLVDFIGRFEKYSDDVNKLFQKIGCNKQIGHARKSKRGPYRDYYDDETRNIIRELCKVDIEYFGYEF